MKIIITYASAGAGHFKAAEAIYNCLKENHQEIDIKLIDVLEGTKVFFRFNYTWGYSFLIRYAPILWWWAFWITDFKPLRKITRSIAVIIDLLSTEAFTKLLVKENPDFIISTHFLSSEIAAYLKVTQKINSKIVTVITDFGVHPFWISRGTDVYIVASSFAKQKLISQGIDAGSIKELGIPIDAKFLKPYDRDSLCRKLNVDVNKFTVLIMTGSFGLGPIEKIVELLYKDVQILVVCAANKKLYAHLTSKNYPNVFVFGFIDNAQELMAVSDIIITKPGGLSISESLAMELVPIFISPIPGQETSNEKVLKRYGVGISLRCIKDIRNIVLDFKARPDKIQSIKEKIKKIKKPYAAMEICNVVCQSSIGDTA